MFLIFIDKWLNNGIVLRKNNERYLMSTINLKLRLYSFASRISKESIFLLIWMVSRRLSSIRKLTNAIHQKAKTEFVKYF